MRQDSTTRAAAVAIIIALALVVSQVALAEQSAPTTTTSSTVATTTTSTTAPTTTTTTAPTTTTTAQSDIEEADSQAFSQEEVDELCQVLSDVGSDAMLSIFEDADNGYTAEQLLDELLSRCESAEPESSADQASDLVEHDGNLSPVAAPRNPEDCPETVKFGEGTFPHCSEITEWEPGFGPLQYEKTNWCLLDNPDVRPGELWICHFITEDGSNSGSERTPPDWVPAPDKSPTRCTHRFGEAITLCDINEWEQGYGPQDYEKANNCTLDNPAMQPGESWSCQPNTELSES